LTLPMARRVPLPLPKTIRRQTEQASDLAISSLSPSAAFLLLSLQPLLRYLLPSDDPSPHQLRPRSTPSAELSRNPHHLKLPHNFSPNRSLLLHPSQSDPSPTSRIRSTSLLAQRPFQTSSPNSLKTRRRPRQRMSLRLRPSPSSHRAPPTPPVSLASALTQLPPQRSSPPTATQSPRGEL
jgi:hypothetical protein